MRPLENTNNHGYSRIRNKSATSHEYLKKTRATIFLLLSYHLKVSPVFTSLAPSLLNCFHYSTIPSLLSLLYSLHFSALFPSLKLSLLCSFLFSTCSLPFSTLHVSALFTSLFFALSAPRSHLLCSFPLCSSSLSSSLLYP